MLKCDDCNSNEENVKGYKVSSPRLPFAYVSVLCDKCYEATKSVILEDVSMIVCPVSPNSTAD